MAKLVRITTSPLSLNVLLRNQMRFMQDEGIEVLMVAGEGEDWQNVIANEHCNYEIIPMTRKITPLTDLKCLYLLYKFLKKEKPDIVHSHTPKAGLLAMLAAKLAGIKIRVHTIAGLRFMTAKGYTRKILVAMEKLTARAATHVWPNSFSLMKYIKENKLVRTDKLEVIGKGSSNGINLKRYSMAALKQDKLDEIKRSIDYNEELCYFLSVGRIVNDKGIDELLKAFSGMHKKYPTTRLILVGAFEDELDPISDMAREILQTHPGVIHAGWSDAVEYYMQFSCALVHPSHREGFPNVLLQAGAMSCPVICSRIEGNIDIVDHKKTGLLFEVRDQEDLQEKMEYLIQSPDEVKKYAQSLQEKVTRHFDQSAVHRNILQRYVQLLGTAKSENYFVSKSINTQF